MSEEVKGGETVEKRTPWRIMRYWFYGAVTVFALVIP